MTITSNCYGAIDPRINLTLIHPAATADMLGYLPCWLNNDPRMASASSQFDYAYDLYGGWQPRDHGWQWDAAGNLVLPGDPHPYHLLAKATVGDETVYFYRSAWTGIGPASETRPTEIARLD